MFCDKMCFSVNLKLANHILSFILYIIPLVAFVLSCIILFFLLLLVSVIVYWQFADGVSIMPNFLLHTTPRLTI